MRLAALDPQDSLRLTKNGIYEPVETEFVWRMLRPGQVFVDVGAHIGYYTALAAEIVGPRGAVYAFEPCPSNYALLRRNIWPFGDIVQAYPLAVSDSVRTTQLYLSEENSGDHRLAPVAGRSSLEVKSVALDTFGSLRGVGVDFIKIDVQGHELEVIRGARELLGRSTGILGIVEFSPQLLRMAGTKPEDLISAIAGLGFKTYMRLGNAIVPAPVADLPRRKHHVNLILSREEIA